MIIRTILFKPRLMLPLSFKDGVRSCGNVISRNIITKCTRNPTIYYADGSQQLQNILQDLKKAGYNMNADNIITLTDNQISELRARIPGVLLPFIYFPVEDKTNWKRIGFIAGGSAVGATISIIAAPVVLGAVGFTFSGVAVGSAAAAAQSVFYGGATGGIFSLLQSAGVVGFGIFGNTVIGLTGAGLGAGLSSMSSGDGGDSEITHNVAVKYVGLYRNYIRRDDYKKIQKFVENKLKIPLESGSYRQYLEEMGQILSANNRGIELPGVIVYFKTTEIQ